MQTLTWRKLQNKKIATDISRLAEPLEGWGRETFWRKHLRLIWGILLGLFILLALGLAGNADLKIMQ